MIIYIAIIILVLLLLYYAFKPAAIPVVSQKPVNTPVAIQKPLFKPDTPVDIQIPVDIPIVSQAVSKVIPKSYTIPQVHSSISNNDLMQQIGDVLFAPKKSMIKSITINTTRLDGVVVAPKKVTFRNYLNNVTLEEDLISFTNTTNIVSAGINSYGRLAMTAIHSIETSPDKKYPDLVLALIESPTSPIIEKINEPQHETISNSLKFFSSVPPPNSNKVAQINFIVYDVPRTMLLTNSLDRMSVAKDINTFTGIRNGIDMVLSSYGNSAIKAILAYESIPNSLPVVKFESSTIFIGPM